MVNGFIIDKANRKKNMEFMGSNLFLNFSLLTLNVGRYLVPTASTKGKGVEPIPQLSRKW